MNGSASPGICRTDSTTSARRTPPGRSTRSRSPRPPTPPNSSIPTSAPGFDQKMADNGIESLPVGAGAQPRQPRPRRRRASRPRAHNLARPSAVDLPLHLPHHGRDLQNSGGSASVLLGPGLRARRRATAVAPPIPHPLTPPSHPPAPSLETVTHQQLTSHVTAADYRPPRRILPSFPTNTPSGTSRKCSRNLRAAHSLAPAFIRRAVFAR